MPDWKKLIEGKIALAARAKEAAKNKLGSKKSVKKTIPPNVNERVPAGQKQVTNFPVLDLGVRPNVNTTNWTLRVFGMVENELKLDWAAFRKLPQIRDVSDFHCVTRWSQLDMDWEGVSARELLMLAAPLPLARFVTLHGYDGYTTNISLEALLDDDVIIAHSVFGKSLTAEHGGPVRLVVPKRYAWKSAKWLKAIELHIDDKPGFWEVRGYHNYADPFLEQRFSE
ncbi:MAG TPA: sulfite oxidase-like oxidoreductase [Methylophilaceae bacterium]|nr:sulfite oxidase-like oxidoreductase [Methylophilaceae bacterium]